MNKHCSKNKKIKNLSNYKKMLINLN